MQVSLLSRIYDFMSRLRVCCQQKCITEIITQLNQLIEKDSQYYSLLTEKSVYYAEGYDLFGTLPSEIVVCAQTSFF